VCVNTTTGIGLNMALRWSPWGADRECKVQAAEMAVRSRAAPEIAAGSACGAIAAGSIRDDLVARPLKKEQNRRFHHRRDAGRCPTGTGGDKIETSGRQPDKNVAPGWVERTRIPAITKQRPRVSCAGVGVSRFYVPGCRGCSIDNQP